MNKKIIVLSLCLTSVLALSSCKGKSDNSAATVTPAPSRIPSSDTNYDGDYHAGNNGTVDGNNNTGNSTPTPGLNNGSSPSGNGNIENPGSQIIDDAENAVDDLVNNAKNALRRDKNS